MKMLRRFLQRFRNLLARPAAARRLREEMEEHLVLQTEAYLAAGMSPEEAHRQARLKFGPAAAVAESYHAESGLPLIENLLRDLRFAARQLRKSPGYAVITVLTLALGIGANSAIFLLTWSILLKSLPVPHPEQLVRYTFRNGEGELGLSFPQYQALEKRQRVATGLFAWHNDEATLRTREQTARIPVGLATGSIFNVLDLKPVLGRGLDSRAGEPGAPYQPEALLTYDYWKTAFHGDPAVIGESLNVDHNTVTVVGVLPQGFAGTGPDENIDLLLPLSFERAMHGKNSMLDQSGAFWLTVMGRLRPGETLPLAQANLGAIRNQVNEDADPQHYFLSGGFFSNYQLSVEPGRNGSSRLRWRFARPLLALEALCGLMMMLCAVNVALLVVSRVSGRLQEFALRSALGASRGRLVAQVITETILIGVLGLLCGAWLGWQLAAALVRMISQPGAPEAVHLHAGLLAWTFTAALSLAAALFAGLWPAWRASRTAPAADLRQTASSGTVHRLGRWIIPTQVALGVVLLNAALLLGSTLLAYLRENSGFSAGNTVLAELNPESATTPSADQAANDREALRQAEAAPGVEAAALMSMAPLNNGFSASDFNSRDAQGHLHLNEQTWPEAVSRSYFAVMGTRILKGRAFAAQDASGERVCILSAGAARYFFPDQPVLGQTLFSGDGTGKPEDRKAYRVIGVAEDARFTSLLDPAPIMVYLPIEREEAGAFIYSALAVRASSPQLAAATVRRIQARIFPGAAPPRVWLFRDAMDYDLSRQRLLSSVSGGFALLALVLVATGLYGILARNVAERRREIGIRMALGAERRQIVASFARAAALRIGAGVAAGAVLAALAGRLLRSMLYGVMPHNPWVAFATLGMLAAVMTLAFVFPAAQAARIDPMKAIREE